MNVKATLTEAIHSASSIQSEVKEIVQLRRELLKAEAAEYTQALQKKLVALVGLATLAFFSVCLLLVSTVGTLGALLRPYLVEHLRPYSWQLVGGCMALLFLVFCLVLLNVVKKKPESAPFAHSLHELQQDQKWLKSLTKNKN